MEQGVWEEGPKEIKSGVSGIVLVHVGGWRRAGYDSTRRERDGTATSGLEGMRQARRWGARACEGKGSSAAGSFLDVFLSMK